MNYLGKIKSKIEHTLRMFFRMNIEFDQIKFNQGLILSELGCRKKFDILSDHEFRVYSQWGEDGIIQHLVRSIEIKNKTFIEFGVEDFHESNCRFLMQKNDWKGFVIDGSERNIRRLKSSHFYWKHHLLAMKGFVSRENINGFLVQSGFDEDLGILSIDLDGVDYFIFESIVSHRPRILIMEYNSVFGSEKKISVPYRPDFFRTKAHYSNLYFGASLPALNYLAEKKGYALVGGNSAGCNAFFVRQDLLNDIVRKVSVAEAYRPSNYRESRNFHGQLDWLAGEERSRAIRGLPVLNVETREIEYLD